MSGFFEWMESDLVVSNVESVFMLCGVIMWINGVFVMEVVGDYWVI